MLAAIVASASSPLSPSSAASASASSSVDALSPAASAATVKVAASAGAALGQAAPASTSAHEPVEPGSASLPLLLSTLPSLSSSSSSSSSPLTVAAACAQLEAALHMESVDALELALANADEVGAAADAASASDAALAALDELVASARLRLGYAHRIESGGGRVRSGSQSNVQSIVALRIVATTSTSSFPPLSSISDVPQFAHEILLEPRVEYYFSRRLIV